MSFDRNLTPRKYDIDLSATYGKIEGVFLASSPLSQAIKLVSNKNQSTEKAKLQSENKKLLKKLELLKRKRKQFEKFHKILKDKDDLIKQLEDSICQQHEEGLKLKALVKQLIDQNDLLRNNNPESRISESLHRFKSKFKSFVENN